MFCFPGPEPLPVIRSHYFRTHQICAYFGAFLQVLHCGKKTLKRVFRASRIMVLCSWTTNGWIKSRTHILDYIQTRDFSKRRKNGKIIIYRFGPIWFLFLSREKTFSILSWILKWWSTDCIPSYTYTVGTILYIKTLTTLAIARTTKSTPKAKLMFL